MTKVREILVMGGNGSFHLDGGYTLPHSHYYDHTTDNAIVEYNVIVLYL